MFINTKKNRFFFVLGLDNGLSSFLIGQNTKKHLIMSCISITTRAGAIILKISYIMC